MLSTIAHLGPPVTPSELWLAWNRDPLVWCGLVAAALIYRELWSRAPRHDDAVARWQRRAFVAGMAVMAIALVSPLDALGASLASGHMVQHLLLTMVAAPLLVIGAPMHTMVRGLPPPWRRAVGRWRATAPVRQASRVLGQPITAGVLYALVLWLWHARAPYEAALQHHVVHGLEHACFLVTALVSWAAILNLRRRRHGGHGTSVLVLFGLSVQCGLLGVLMTFAPEPWYPSYEATTTAWGLSALADQQLAGVIMWVPAGGIYLVAALALLAMWINPSAQFQGTRPWVGTNGVGLTARRHRSDALGAGRSTVSDITNADPS